MSLQTESVGICPARDRARGRFTAMIGLRPFPDKMLKAACGVEIRWLLPEMDASRFLAAFSFSRLELFISPAKILSSQRVPSG